METGEEEEEEQEDKELVEMLEDMEQRQENRELAEIMEEMEERITGETEEDMVDLTGRMRAEFCMMCAHAPCLCLILKTELKIKMLREDRTEEQEPDMDGVEEDRTHLGAAVHYSRVGNKRIFENILFLFPYQKNIYSSSIFE